MFKRKEGFTLIELLIVVAIIGILAAIAIPNFLEAQTRAKVARAKSEIRNLAVAEETYYIDNNSYPPSVENAGTGALDTANAAFSIGFVSWKLTTPVAHQSSMPNDPFGPKKPDPGTPWLSKYRCGVNYLQVWIMTSRGPDLDQDMQESDYVDPNVPGWGEIAQYLNQFQGTYMEYDPTNGTISDGDVYRTGP